MDTSNWSSNVTATSMVEDMRSKIHVLFVDHESSVHVPIINMLEHFFLKVTTVKFASTALAILAKEKSKFDLVLGNIHSPDACGYKLLYEAVKMDMPAILLFEEDDVMLTKMALEVGALLCIRKPITVEIARYLWQLVAWEKTRIRKKNELNMASNNMHDNIGVGEFNVIISENADSEENPNNIKIKCENDDHQEIVSLRSKVWTEWTQELHDKFMFAVRQLGEGRCYPKDILELMKVPGLTRMQVASHLQKCRSGNWTPPNKRKPKTSDTKRLFGGTARKSGFMPASLTNFNIQQIHQITPKSSIPFPHLTFEIGHVDWDADHTGQHVSDAQSHASSYNETDYFEFPNMDSVIQSFCADEEVPINYNEPVMNNANVEKDWENTSKTRDDDVGKAQVVVKKEEE